MPAIDYDPLAPRNWDDPYPTYRRLRDEAPVHHAAGSNTYTLSRYDDVIFALRHPEIFSSATAFDVLLRQIAVDIGWRDLVAFARFLVRARVDWKMLVTGAADSIIGVDPPRHEELRGIVNRAFTLRRIEGWSARIGEVVEDCMAKLRRGERFDVVEDLAIPVPMVVIAEMIGVETERLADFKGWSNAIVSGVSSSDKKRARPAMLDAFTELSRYIDGVVAQRRRAPADDLISVLVDPARGATLGREAIMQLILILLIAGNETTTNLIGNAIVALLRNPDQLERALAMPELVPNLVEETIRWDGPVQFIVRRATRDVEIAGTTIPAEGRVIVLLGSANRDERHFENPDEFDLSRETKGHLGFGLGGHFCLGASLARLEARTALAALVPELPRVRAPIGQLAMIDSVLVRGRQRIALEPVA
ncbi:MAG TPA: cytochrome P450 [Myxococcota bacterium]|nr:cytochrome P450 [Myxococcota bacterium]